MKKNNFKNYILLSIILLLFFYCKSENKTYAIVKEKTPPVLSKEISDTSLNYCNIIDSMIIEYIHNTTNLYITNHIDLLVEKTGIRDRSEKGLAGCRYMHDSLFYSDMNRYRLALGCDRNK